MSNELYFLSKGNVDPNSDLVNLLESMFVDEGALHNKHVSDRDIVMICTKQRR